MNFKLYLLIFMLFLKDNHSAPCSTRCTSKEFKVKIDFQETTENSCFEPTTEEFCDDYVDNESKESKIYEKYLHPILIIILLILAIVTIIVLCCLICSTIGETLLLCGCEGWVRLCFCCGDTSDDDSYNTSSNSRSGSQLSGLHVYDTSKYQKIDSRQSGCCGHQKKKKSSKGST